MANLRLRSLMKITLLIAFLAVAYHVVRHSEIGQLLTAQRLQDYVENVGPGLARLLYVLVYIVGAVLLLPGLLLSFVGAVLFGVWEGTLYTWIGATIGATCAFLLARLLGRDFVDQLLRGKLRALDDRLRERGFLSLLIIRLVPLLPFNGVNFGCGLTSIRLRDYVLATALGIVPGTFVYQYLFAKLGESLLTEGFSWSDLASLEVLAPLAVFAVFVLVTGWLAHRLGAREQASEKPPSEP